MDGMFSTPRGAYLGAFCGPPAGKIDQSDRYSHCFSPPGTYQRHPDEILIVPRVRVGWAAARLAGPLARMYVDGS